ncbi:fatty acid desaturase [Pectobacterium actinidiae]|uniref:fatty acid desaturase n=1 Tax=Pectobacterium actinidiae TaxID=1507808 RepID=UPI0023AAEF8C|nr:fatty acid desaturase [Pectobacterium actinidiae]WEF11423.1 fatty acid desaturase [Pectobacterium actinidiae]
MDKSKSNIEYNDDISRAKIIRKVIIDHGKVLRKRHPILNHQDLLGFSACTAITVIILLSSLCYLYGYISWWVCLIINTICISVAHEIEHDLIHNLYFRKNRFIHHIMMAIVWLMRPSTASPWMRRDVHLLHHQVSGSENDVEEKFLGNGRKWGLLRILMLSDLVVAAVVMMLNARSELERKKLLSFSVKAFFPFAVFYSLIWYSFLIFHSINIYSTLTETPIMWSDSTTAVMNFIDVAVVIIVGPNMLWSFCLHFISSNLHYHGDNESGNVIQETQVLNPWWLYPINLFCFNFGSTHAIHHFVVNEPFYIRQLSAPVAHRIMKEMGVRFNDFGSFSRANRWKQGQQKHE